MQIPVLVEPVAGNRYRAAALGYAAEGASKNDALAELTRLLVQRTIEGAQIVYLDLPNAPPPWAEFAGDLRDDPMLEEWKAAMAEYRKEMEERFESLEDS
jgi:hypothetical protein